MKLIAEECSICKVPDIWNRLLTFVANLKPKDLSINNVDKVHQDTKHKSVKNNKTKQNNNLLNSSTEFY